MVRQQKNRAHTRKNSSTELGELLMQTASIGITLAEKGLVYAENAASKKDLFKTYPYLNQALSNVKNIVALLRAGMDSKNNGTKNKNERTKNKKSYKKISKQKTL